MSCPCQPFSAAGKGDGFNDERHLWPAGQYLISQCKPDIVIGEQVASKDADTWIDLVHTDMEALGYAFGAIPFPSAGIGAPHIRDRMYWVADSNRGECDGFAELRGVERNGENTGRTEGCGGIAACGEFCRMGNTIRPGLEGQPRHGDGSDEPGRVGAEQDGSIAEVGAIVRPGQTNGFWRDTDWLGCRDGKWRPVRPGTFPLVNGASARVGRLRGYGNAINAEAATAFIESYLGK